MDTTRYLLDLNGIQPRRSSLGALLIHWVQGGAGDGAFYISEEVSAAVLVNSTLNSKALNPCIFLGSKITADGDCNHEIKRRLLLGRKAMTDLDSILKSRDITLPTKVHLVKAMVFPLVMYGCESWTIKKAEH